METSDFKGFSAASGHTAALGSCYSMACASSAGGAATDAQPLRPFVRPVLVPALGIE